MSITSDKLYAMMRDQEFEKGKEGGSYSTYRYLPHIKIDNEMLFNKADIDEWIKYNSLQYQKY